MKCADVKRNIKAYIDGELWWIGRCRAARHLACCSECREEELAMRMLTQELQNTPQEHAPEGLREKVLGSIDTKPVPRRTPFSPARAAVACAIILITLAILMPVFQNAKEASPRLAVPHGPVERISAKRAMPQPTVPAAPATKAPADEVAITREKAPGWEPGAAKSSVGQMIIKTGDITVRVARFEPAYDRAVSIAKSRGGYVSDSSVDRSSGSAASGMLTLKVPAQTFERVIVEIGRLGKVTSKHISGEDVTGEVVDLESRLRNKRAEERQYLDIMNRAKRINDVMTVSNELYRVRGEIEEIQGRIKLLRSSSSMSTINLTLEGKKQQPVPQSSIESTWNRAIASLADTGSALLAALIWIGVYSPLWLMVFAMALYGRKYLIARRES